MAKSLVYFQSGGPTAVINCSLYGVIQESLKHAEIAEILGSKYGIEGLINGDFIPLSGLSEERMSLLKGMS